MKPEFGPQGIRYLASHCVSIDTDANLNNHIFVLPVSSSTVGLRVWRFFGSNQLLWRRPNAKAEKQCWRNVWGHVSVSSHFGIFIVGCFWQWSYHNISFVFHYVLPILPWKQKTSWNLSDKNQKRNYQNMWWAVQWEVVTSIFWEVICLFKVCF